MKKPLALLVLLSIGTGLYGSDEYDSASEMNNKIKVTSTGIEVDFDFDEDLKHITKNIGKKDLIEDKNTQSKKSVKTKLPLVQFPQVYFSPGIKNFFIKCIHDEQEKLEGAWYRFTLYKAAEAIVKGIKERNISVSLAVNRDYTTDFCSPLKLIIQNGGHVYKKDKGRASEKQEQYEHLHHKFMIFHKNSTNKKLIWTGSFNATGQANVNNFENVVILDDDESIAKFETEFASVLTYCTPITEEECVSEKDTDPALSYARGMNDIPLITSSGTSKKNYYKKSTTRYPKSTTYKR